MFVKWSVCSFDLDYGPCFSFGIDCVGALLEDLLLFPFREDGLKNRWAICSLLHVLCTLIFYSLLPELNNIYSEKSATWTEIPIELIFGQCWKMFHGKFLYLPMFAKSRHLIETFMFHFTHIHPTIRIQKQYCKWYVSKNNNNNNMHNSNNLKFVLFVNSLTHIIEHSKPDDSPIKS